MKLTYNEDVIVESFANFLAKHYTINDGNYYKNSDIYDIVYDTFEVKEHFKEWLNAR